VTRPVHPVALLDLDGTVIDSVRLIRESHRHATRTVLGVDWEDEVLVRHVGRPLLEQMEVFSPERARELYDVYREWNHANTAALLQPYPGIEPLLAELRDAGVRLGVVTSKSRDAVDLAFAVLPLDGYFDVVITSDDSERHKPDPDPLLVALDRMGGAVEDAVYVGDAPYDIRAGHAAGMATIAVTWGFFGRHDLASEAPGAIVDSVDGLRAALLGPA
jgi:pyrophosphatase PpaX